MSTTIDTDRFKELLLEERQRVIDALDEVENTELSEPEVRETKAA